ncbi:cartilage acidic protein 1 isoform X2 [Numida meleagris]|uniref:cartilage acidic protein 1 isoform X2 n=1 Tax=Numida meleagris TaxID=8996 RepID=UPI000B3E2AD1|nr:cartilage acidic protein 1 isoform X2 [Numida meleagris]
MRSPRRRGGTGQPPAPVPRMLALCLLSLAWLSEGSQRSEPMFAAVTHRLLPPDYDSNPTQLNYGVAVTDLDADGNFEIVVAGYNGPNLVLKYDKVRGRLVNVAEDERSSPYYALRDRPGNAIGVTACDIDGDGREEIYFLNTNNAFSGMATYTDKLFKLRNGRWEDLLSDEVNRDVASRFAGRSVACVDRMGSGRYSIYIANYASGKVGPHALLEMDVAASDPARGVVVLVDVAAQAGVSKYTGLDDPYQHGRGVALADFNRDGRVDIVYGNWNGPHRLYLQAGAPGRVRFRDIATPKFSMPSPVRTVIAADFDNDQELEVFFNNIAYRGSSANRLFRLIRREHSDPIVEELNPGDALEPEGRGTGGAVTDFDGDGMLDLILSHGESMAQPLSVFKSTQGVGNNWLRVVPRTRFGAFARGAKVVLFTRRSGAHLRIIDGGSGYLCEMEPVAHFGLGRDEASSLEVTWPDGRILVRAVASSETNSILEVPYPRDTEEPPVPALLETPMSVLSSPLSAPGTSPSASTPTAGTAAAATSVAPAASSPMRMAQHVWLKWPFLGDTPLLGAGSGPSKVFSSLWASDSAFASMHFNPASNTQAALAKERPASARLFFSLPMWNCPGRARDLSTVPMLQPGTEAPALPPPRRLRRLDPVPCACWFGLRHVCFTHPLCPWGVPPAEEAAPSPAGESPPPVCFLTS